jgi:aspartate/methionine/tyrosine aminotransferase
MVRDYQRARDFFVPELNKLEIFSCPMPKGAFYAFPRVKDTRTKSADLVESLLKKANLLAVPGSSFGKYGEGYVRFVYAQTMDVLKKTIDRLRMATD